MILVCIYENKLIFKHINVNLSRLFLCFNLFYCSLPWFLVFVRLRNSGAEPPVSVRSVVASSFPPPLFLFSAPQPSPLAPLQYSFPVAVSPVPLVQLSPRITHKDSFHVTQFSCCKWSKHISYFIATRYTCYCDLICDLWYKEWSKSKGLLNHACLLFNAYN